MKERSSDTWHTAMAGAGLLAGPLFALALWGFAAGAPGFRHAMHPPALLGALGQPGATAWNLVGFVAVGALALLGVQACYAALRRDGADAGVRIGATLLSLSALAFAGQGLVPLDLSRALDVGQSRIHVAIWNAWWLAAAAGALLVARGAWRLPRWRSLLPVGVAVALAMVLALQTDLLPLGSGWRQRLALAAWFGWIAWGSWLALPRAAQP